MLIGHREQVATLRAAFESGRMHHAWLLAGRKGLGKASFARAAATWVLARAAGPQAGIGEGFDVDDDHPTAHLIAAGSHLDLRTLERVPNPKTGTMRAEIAIDQLVRRDTSPGEPLRSLFQSTPALSDWRVVIIDSLDEMNRSAANALLKHLEEPPPGTLFLCISHSPGRLLPTLRSRCRRLAFGPLDDSDVDAVLAAEVPDLSLHDRDALVALAQGVPGHALRFAEAGIAQLRQDLAALAAAPPITSGARTLALAKSLSGKASASRYEAFLELAPATLAAAARNRRGPALDRTVTAWERANRLAAGAVGLQLDPQSVVFEIAGLIAEVGHGDMPQ